LPKDEEIDANPLSTQVGNFRRLDEISEGDEWNEELAKSIFYQFIIPNAKPLAFQARVKEGLGTWITDKGTWPTKDDAERDFTFDVGTFNTINDTVLKELLSSTMLELQDADKFVGSSATYKDAETGEERNVKFGYVLTNPKGFSIADDPESDLQENKRYSEWRETISKGKTEIEALKEERKNWNGEKLKVSFNERIQELEEDIKKAENIIEKMTNFTFNDNITLEDVINDTKEAQRFYLLMSFDPEEEGAAIALGNLIAEEYTEWKSNKDLFEDIYNVKFDDYEKAVEERNKKYVGKLGVSAKLRGFLESDDTEYTLDVDDFLSVLDLEGDEHYPITVQDPKGEYDTIDLENSANMKDWLRVAPPEELVDVTQNLADKYLKAIQALALGQGAIIKITPRKPKEDVEGKRTEFQDRPIELSVEDIATYLIGDIFDADSIVVPKKLTDKNKSNVKLGIQFKETLLPMKKLMARAIGAENEKAIGSSKSPLVKDRMKGKVIINHQQPLGDVGDLLPYFKATELHKNIREALTGFIRRTSKDSKEFIEGKKKWISEGNYGHLQQVLEYLVDIQEIQESNTDLDLDLEIPDLSYWVKANGQMKLSYNALINKIQRLDTEGTAETNFLNKLQELKSVFGKLDIIKENYLEAVEEVESIEVADVEMDELSEEELNNLPLDEKEEYLSQRDKLQGQMSAQTDAQNTGQQRLDEMSYVEQAEQALDGIFEYEIEGNLDDELEKIKKSELIDYLSDMDGDLLQDTVTWLNGLVSDLSSYLKYKKIDITGGVFLKDLREFLGVLNYEDNKIEEIISTVEKVDESKDTLVTQEAKGDRKEKTKQVQSSKALASVQSLKRLRDSFNEDFEKVSGDFKNPEKEDFIRIVGAIDLENVVATAIEKTSLNDARHDEVYLKPKKLEVVINTKDNRLEVKGTLTWKSSSRSYLDYKTQGRTAPTYFPQGAEPKKAKKGAKISYSGQEQLSTSIPYDEVRYEYYKEIQGRARLLRGNIRG